MDTQAEPQGREGSPAIADIEASIEQRLAQLAQINRELDALRTAKAVLIGDLSAIASKPPPKKRVRPRLRFHRKDSHTEQVTTAIYKILTEAGELRRSLIAQRVEEMGIDLGEGDKVRNLSAYLSQDPRFVSDGRGNWRNAQNVELESADFPEDEGPE